MEIDELKDLMIEYEIDDILFPYIKNHLKVLFAISTALCTVLYFEFLDFSIARITFLISMLSGVDGFFKLLSVLKERKIDRYDFFDEIFPLSVDSDFQIFFLKKHQTAVIYVLWFFWFMFCLMSLDEVNQYWLFLMNYLMLGIGAFFTFFIGLHFYYVFAVKPYQD